MNSSFINPKKNKAFELRKKGKSYRQIAESLNISKSTVSLWFRDIDWSKNIQQQLTEKAKLISTKRLTHLNNLKKIKYNKIYNSAKDEAKLKFKKFQRAPLFLIGLSIYWGEGDKIFKNGAVRVANTDPNMLFIFNQFLIKFCSIDKNKIKGYIIIYPDNQPNQCLKYWSKGTGINITNFFKPTVIKGRHKKRKLKFGICSIVVNDKKLKKVVLTWLDLFIDKYSSAGVV